MIGLDTNVVIRYLVQDDPNQSKRANQAIEKWKEAGETLWICQITLCEICWVLERCYQLSREELVSVLTNLLQTRHLQIERDDLVWQALRDFEKNTKVGFPDCLIGRQNAYHECIHTFTFDKDAVKQLPSTFKSIP